MAMPFDEAGGKNWERYQRWSPEEAETTLQAPFCPDPPSSNQLVLFLHSLLALGLVGLVQDLRKRDVGRQGDSGIWAGLGREIPSAPLFL